MYSAPVPFGLPKEAEKKEERKGKPTEEGRGKEGAIPPRSSSARSDLAKQGSVTSLLPATYMCHMLRLSECPWPWPQDVGLYVHGHVCLGLPSPPGAKAIPEEEAGGT